MFTFFVDSLLKIDSHVIRKADAYVWWALCWATWSDNMYQKTQEIDCCGFNKSFVLVFGIWGIINYLLRKTKSYSFIPFWGDLLVFYKDYFGEAIKEYCTINVSTSIVLRIPRDIKGIYKILNVLFSKFGKGQHISAIEQVWKPAFVQNRVVN